MVIANDGVSSNLHIKHYLKTMLSYTGCLTLLEILEIYWKFTKSPGNFFGLVCEFVVNVSYNSRISECVSTKYLVVNQDQLMSRLVISISVS